MENDQILEWIRLELVSKSDEKTRLQSQHYFKEEVNTLGVKAAEVSIIAREGYKKVSTLSKSNLFDLCEMLWQTGFLEESFIACHWSNQKHRYFEESDFVLFEKWIEKYIDNWASCDTFCNHTVGSLLVKFPDLVHSLKQWTKSENRWMRRASAVSLIVPAREGKFPDEILEIATLLLHDKDDMVQKGYGWMLKVSSKYHEDAIFEFIMRNKATMPRTSLRYAIEKMPVGRRAEAMRR
jgi:3-methyladenine DNA glycosylase AlkD